jgi:hypothetical protein
VFKNVLVVCGMQHAALVSFQDAASSIGAMQYATSSSVTMQQAALVAGSKQNWCHFSILQAALLTCSK